MESTGELSPPEFGDTFEVDLVDLERRIDERARAGGLVAIRVATWILLGVALSFGLVLREAYQPWGRYALPPAIGALLCAALGYSLVRLPVRWVRLALLTFAAIGFGVAHQSVRNLGAVGDSVIYVAVFMCLSYLLLRLPESMLLAVMGVGGWLWSARALHDPTGRYDHWVLIMFIVAVIFVVLGWSRLRTVRALELASAGSRAGRARLSTQAIDLEDARDAALASARAKGRFLANMSHELRTPLNAVIGLSDLLTGETALTDLQREYVLTIRKSAGALVGVVADILELARVQAGAVVLQPGAFSVTDLVSEVARTLSVEAHGKGVAVIPRVAPEVPFKVEGDALRLRQVLMNLGGNAVKFTDVGHVILAVSLDPNPPADPAADPALVSLRFEVSDTGVGIPSDRHESIFSPFEQELDSNSGRPAGTGLGLTIARELCERMGGRLEVDSELGAGSRFFFSVGFVETESLADQARA
ncbi:MAG: sensor histidine kinase, partial [Planctomycetota bacterium]